MANEKSSIEWTDSTWNVVTGCDRVSAGCDRCYALALAARLKAMGNPRYRRDGEPPTSGPGFGVALHPDLLTVPFRWTKPRRVFVNSMSDLFHAEVPTEFVARVFAAMALAPRHTFQVLTKRPQRMARLLASDDFVRAVGRAMDGLAGSLPPGEPLALDRCCRSDRGAMPPAWPLPNVWVGVSVESRDVAWRIDWLVRTPAAVRFLSCEPLLGYIDLAPWLWRSPRGAPRHSVGAVNPAIDARQDVLQWVITGGESGPGHRPLDPDWARALRDQCVEAGVAYFHKQNGGRTPKVGGRLLDGREWNEMPPAAESAGRLSLLGAAR